MASGSKVKKGRAAGSKASAAKKRLAKKAKKDKKKYNDVPF